MPLIFKMSFHNGWRQAWGYKPRSRRMETISVRHISRTVADRRDRNSVKNNVAVDRVAVLLIKFLIGASSSENGFKSLN